MASKLRVTSIQVKDVLGARQFALAPGKITTLSGRNGSGKSSALQAVQAALGGGNLARLARIGAEGEEIEPEVVLCLEGDGAEYRVEKAGSKTARVRARVGDTAAFEDVARPQDFLRGLYDACGANPVSFLTAKDDERASLLLEALPLTLDRAELARILGGHAKHVPALPERLHPLEELDLVRDAVFRARTGVNRDHRGKADAADQTRRKAPAKIPDDPAPQIAALDGQAAALADLLAREEAGADAKERELVAAARATAEQAEGQARAELASAVGDVRAELARKIAELEDEAGRVIARLQDQAGGKIETAAKVLLAEIGEARAWREAARGSAAAMRDDLGDMRERLAGLRARAQESAAARALHEQAATFEREAGELEAEAKRMTATLDALDTYRRRLAEDLPIPGLSIAGKTISVDGIPYDQLNTQRRIDVAVAVACLRARASRLPVVFVDGAEALDSEHFAALVAALEREGVQAFLGRVADGELQVETAEAVSA